MSVRAGKKQAGSGEQGERREHLRQKVLWWGQIDVGTERYACSVSDLSPGGAKIRLPQDLATNQRIKLAMPPFGEFEGEVCWVNDACIGIQFADTEQSRVAKVIASRLNEIPT
jgi:hypothetical protein